MTYLEHINGPQDLKGLSREQLAILASEIRDVLVESVTKTSGHLGRQVGVWPDPRIFKEVIIPWLVKTLQAPAS